MSILNNNDEVNYKDFLDSREYRALKNAQFKLMQVAIPVSYFIDGDNFRVIYDDKTTKLIKKYQEDIEDLLDYYLSRNKTVTN